ncbi:cilia- and flagella-associated protein 157-like isoform X2 [Antennarius striatus]|uniref:cilia- and flagella-associated protein 157-like isoform X2 n=1 Tax=Antennarius striatus TaxID=241820 RepID=UPI0035B11C00
MPKKKAKERGDHRNEEKTTWKTDSTDSNKSASDDKEKNLYLTQIRYLNERLEGFQSKCDQLESQKKDLNTQCTTLESEKKDIVDYLKRSLLEKEDEVDELAERLESQRQASDRDREAIQLQHSCLRQELQDQIKELTTNHVALVTRFADLEEFQKQKDQMMSHMESLEKKLASHMEEHKDKIHSLEMKALMEKKSLEKEMESHSMALAAEVEHLVEQKVPEKTRLALQENTEVKAQLSQLSEQARVLMLENSALRDRKSQLSVDVDILEQLLSETSRQSCIRKKAVEQLKEKCQHLETELKDCKLELEQLQMERSEVLAEMEALRRDRDSLSEQSSKSRTKVSQLEEGLQEERMRMKRMKIIVREAASTLKHALTEWEEDSVLQWKELMQKLLLVLDPPEPSNSESENDQLHEVQTCEPAANRSESVNPSQRINTESTHHEAGDVGLVPRPTPKHKHISRMGTASSSSNMTLHRKPCGQKAAASLNSTDSAVKFLTSKISFAKFKQ